MKYPHTFLLLLILLLSPLILNAQNMVHNPGFEQVVACPTAWTQLDHNHVTDWDDPLHHSSDYYNTCSANIIECGVPGNGSGYQVPYEGNAYAGFLAYNPNGSEEYVNGVLNALQPNIYYRVSIKVTPAENYVNCSDGLGVYFYTGTLFGPPAIGNVQIDYTPYGIITDTANWTDLVDTFYATQAYTGILIGDFHSVSQTLIPGSTYYFIDYVEVVPIGPFIITNSQTNVSCNGGNDGSAQVTVQGAHPPFTYLWQPGNQTTSSISGLSAGTYICTVTDANATQVNDTFTITEPPVLSVSISHYNTCNNGNNGTATATPTGGTPPYSYSWAPSGGNTANASGLAPGTYTCMVTDANGCITPSTVTITNPPVLTAINSQTNVLCNGGSSGTATVAPSGGTPGYTYQWAPSGGTNATATGLAASSYTCTITDANNCSIQQIFSINEPAALAATTSKTDLQCHGSSSGSASVNATGGMPPYSYSWAPTGGSSATAGSLNAGTYTCTITDANGCTLDETFTLAEPPAINIQTHHTNISCIGDHDGSAGVNVSGGTPGYTYSWAPVSGNDTGISGLGIGVYTCTVTDASGCTATQTIEIFEPDPLSAVKQQQDILCFGGNSGIANVIVSGGTWPYSYLWSPSGGNEETANGLSAGTYVCTITDVNGCTMLDTFVFTQPEPLTADFNFENSPDKINQPILFHNTSTPTAVAFLWQFGDNTFSSDKNPVKTYNDTGLYTVCLIASDTNNCTDTTCQDISSYVVNSVNIPSAFSPNGDGNNDVLYVRGFRIATMHLRIYNRWGNMIFESNSKDNGWDGTYKGKPQVPEAYAYVLDVTFKDGSAHQKQGSVLLLR